MFRWLSSSHTSSEAYSSRHASRTSLLCPFDINSAEARSYGTSPVPSLSAQSRIAMYTAVIGSTFGPWSCNVSSRLTLDIFIKRRASFTSSSMTSLDHRRRARASESRKIESNVRAVVYPIAFSPCSISSCRISAYAPAMYSVRDSGTNGWNDRACAMYARNSCDTIGVNDNAGGRPSRCT